MTDKPPVGETPNAPKPGKAVATAGEPKTARWRIQIFRAWCKPCLICKEFCPKNVLDADELGRPQANRPEDCIGCMQCVERCPDFAIRVTPIDSPDEKGA